MICVSFLCSFAYRRAFFKAIFSFFSAKMMLPLESVTMVIYIIYSPFTYNVSNFAYKGFFFHLIDKVNVQYQNWCKFVANVPFIHLLHFLIHNTFHNHSNRLNLSLLIVHLHNLLLSMVVLLHILQNHLLVLFCVN